MKLNEIKEWSIQKEDRGTKILYTALEQNNLEDNLFSISLEMGKPSELWQLKFGNLENDDYIKYKWDINDPDRLTKTLFLKRVLENEILPLVKNNRIKGIIFRPFGEDGMDSKRLSLFKNLFNKLNNKGEFDWEEKDGNYFISNHTPLTEVKKLIKQLIKEELSKLPFNNSAEEFVLSSDEMYVLYRDLHEMERYLSKQNDNSPDSNDKKNRLKRILKIIDKKFKKY